ncbi:hypothetical protein QA646_26855 (plasmid) [Rhizobium sp. CB3090]|uniref:hypothetical protein n=1 Tax=Rhizobium sp. CB3090 TaxID=3039156 RepID=UPI0024B0A675|nr:hypothetical protein [Rhizobium sp. CB3090]WFU11997.1 hypothetical protein QA646_26855 [Rhizobium sp. CB3090]
MRHIGLKSILIATMASLPLKTSWPGGKQAELATIHSLAAQMAAFAILRVETSRCDESERCDRSTGCISPIPPREPATEALPDDENHRLYVRDLQVFQLCRQLVLAAPTSVRATVQPIGDDNREAENRKFAETVDRWNGDILWAPASQTSDVITRFGDEARAVFGPIPDGDCTDDVAQTIPLQIDGNVVDLKPNPAKPGNPLEFQHRDAAGSIVKWTDTIGRCDKPSLAGSVTYCGMNSRMSRVVKGNIEWLSFCRKSTSSLEIEPDAYWQRSNPKFSRLGIIGFNRATGEIVFFDGTKKRKEFDWTQTFKPPGGHSYSDRQGRAAAEALYDPTFQIACSACHDNKNAYVVDPHIGMARVGYSSDTGERRERAFSLGNYLPGTPRNDNSPFRIIGSGYTSTHAAAIRRAKTVADPNGNCTRCHTLTTQVTGQRFASDAVAQDPWISRPRWAQLLQLRAEQMKLHEIDSHRTDWARQSGQGKIHPWMVPIDGNDLSTSMPEISSDDWHELSNCLWDAGGTECGYRPLYTECPAPSMGSRGNNTKPVDFAATSLPLPPGEQGGDRRLRLHWNYLNDLGGVPERDDVRFDVALNSVPIPSSAQPPAEDDYPTMAETEGKDFVALESEIGKSGAAMLIRNIAYFGHVKFTEPTPSLTPREFRLDLPAQCNRRYLARILPKRFCFDQSGIKYAEEGDLLYADVRCD